MSNNIKFAHAYEKNILLRFLKIVQVYRRLIACITFIGVTATVITCTLLPNIYSSQSLIIPSSQQDQGFLASMLSQTVGSGVLGNTFGLMGGNTQADLYVSILKSHAIKDKIIDRFDLIRVYDIKDRLSTYSVLDKYVSITAGKKDGIIDITVEDKNPKRAADIANAYVEELSKLLLKIDTTGASDNKRYLESRLSSAKTELGKAEEALKKFQTTNKMVDISEQAKGSVKGVADLTAQLLSMDVQLANARRQFTESSQEVKQLKQSIATVKAQIARLEGNGVAGAIPAVGSIPGLGQQYISLMRDFKIQETLVELLAKQYEIANLSELKSTSSIQIIQEARVPDRKSKPKRALLIIEISIASFILALFIAMGCYNFQELDESYRLLLIDRLRSIVGKDKKCQ